MLSLMAPESTREQDPNDAAEHAAVIYPPDAARLIGQHRLDGGPFVIA